MSEYEHTRAEQINAPEEEVRDVERDVEETRQAEAEEAEVADVERESE